MIERQRRRLGFTAAFLASVGALALPWSASGASPVTVAWWHRAVVDTGLPVPLVTVPPESRRPTLAVPEGGLYVENDATGARAMSALRFEAASGAATLTLPVADSVAPPQSRVVACPLRSGWDSGANASWTTRPAVACEKPVDGTVSTDQVVFAIPDIGAFATLEGDAVEIAVLPVEGDTAVFAIAFERPDEQALVAGTPTTTSTSTTTTLLFPGPTVVGGDGDLSATLGPTGAADGAAPSGPSGTPLAPTSYRSAGPRRIVGIGTDGVGRAVVAAGIGTAALGAWLLSGGVPRLRRRIYEEEATP
ncbi:MAG TPA: hypothetical protein VM938_05525 [Acidimicrobiales bacterium]|nr:hypothetical protein [Acidimicrobiales bacterium]